MRLLPKARAPRTALNTHAGAFRQGTENSCLGTERRRGRARPCRSCPARTGDLVLIGAPARLGGTSLGTVAVIAPTRIQYQEMIQAVRYIAGLSERILEVPAD